MIERQAKFMLAPAIVALVVGSGCGSSGPAGGAPDPGRFEGCLPSCIAEAIAWCPVPAGACTSESVAADETSSCYAGGIQTLVYSDAGAAVFTSVGLCYDVIPRMTVINNVPRLESIVYQAGTNNIGCITMDPADPNNRKGTVQCSDCGEANVPSQPFDFDNPACYFFQFLPCGPGCTSTYGIAYDNPSQVCTQGAAGSCPAPP